MLIRNLEIKNFKSFKHIAIKPNNFNVIIGPNSVGKSNFLSIFKFLRDIISVGLENAISFQGGIDYVMNLGTNNARTMSIHLELELKEQSTGIKHFGDKYIKLIPSGFILDFTIVTAKEGRGYVIKEDNFTYNCGFYHYSNTDRLIESSKGAVEFRNIDGIISKKLKLTKKLNLTLDDIVPPVFEPVNIDPELNKYHLFIENHYNIYNPDSINNAIKNIAIYDFDALKDRTSTNSKGKISLEDNGENIAIVLNQLLTNKDAKRELLNYVKYVLPFVDDIDVIHLLDKNLHIALKERYLEQNHIPSYLLSSGTISVIALIVALFFENKHFIFFDEPVSKVHPFLISRIIELMKDAAQKQQIFITTHSPEMVKYAGVENVFGMTRDKKGYSLINKLSQQTEVIKFLENEIGLDELFIQNLLSK